MNCLEHRSDGRVPVYYASNYSRFNQTESFQDIPRRYDRNDNLSITITALFLMPIPFFVAGSCPNLELGTQLKLFLTPYFFMILYRQSIAVKRQRANGYIIGFFEKSTLDKWFV